jgi:putative acetyltransferase
MTATVRPERPDDVPGIDAVLRAAFPSDLEARLVVDLRAAGHLPVSLVAEADGAVVGYAGFSPVTADGGTGIGLAPVAVLPAWQGKGIGGALVGAGVDACRADGYGWCVVLGGPGYYTRFGFYPAAPLGLGNEYGAGDEFMVQELRPGGLAGVSGVVRYGPEFAAFG